MEPGQAVRIVQDLFFNTANVLYDLGLSLPTEKIPSVASKSAHKIKDIEIFTEFLKQNPEVKYIRLQWVDFTSMLRVRVLPVKEANALFYSQRSIGITKACLGLLQVDIMIPEFSPVGEYELIPCFESLRLGNRKGYATVQAEFIEKDGAEAPICPRTVLRRQTEKATECGISFLMGFEIEVVFMKPDPGQGTWGGSSQVTQGHAWSSAGSLRNDNVMEMVEKIMDQLNRSGIEVLQFHPESAPGQFEFVTGPLAPLDAVDTLVASREIIFAVAEQYSLRATLVPKPFAQPCGTGAHVHVSLTPEAKYPSFYAGVLNRLHLIAAFSLCNTSSYDRVVDSCWGGGRYICWGTQNRECPLRKIDGSHWEYKWMDGFANPYLSMAAFLAAGLQGILDNDELHLRDTQQDPARMTAKERQAHGINRKLPGSLGEALDGLAGDTEMRQLLGTEVIDVYLAIKKGETDFLNTMAAEDQRQFLIERY
jgi:glutamine synthetase